MIKLKELLKTDKRIRLIVEDEDYKAFLTYAKQEGCLWRNGEVIKPSISKSSANTKIVAITSDMLIYHPSNWLSLMSLQNTSEYYFKNIKEDIVVDEHIEKSFRTNRIDKEYEAARKVKQLAYINKCKENQIISKLQIKYQSAYSKLQKYFFVRYENNNELLKLLLLFKRFGYENINELALDNVYTNIKVIIVDNEAVTFSQVNTFDVDLALISRKKIYDVSTFEKIMIDIFGD